jgi:predicted transcriptional regulator
MKYRSRSEIIHAILNVAEDGVTKTRIMYGAYISYAQLVEYLGLLMDRKLLHFDKKSNYYTLTEKGAHLRHLLENLEMLTEMPAEI